MNIRSVLLAGRQRWWLPVGGVLAGLVVAGLMIWQTPERYSSSTRLWISATGQVDPTGAYEGGLFSQQRMASYAELLTGQELAGKTVADLRLDLSPAQLAGEVVATPLPNTVVIDVTVTDPSPQRARVIADGIGREFALYAPRLERSSTNYPSPVRVNTIQPATLNLHPVSPDPVRYLSLAAMIGLLVGLALALWRHHLDDAVRSSADVPDGTGGGVVGEVPDDQQLGARHLVTELEPGSITAEAFRAIRTTLRLLNPADHPRVVAVTGSAPGAGATTVAVNLAIVLAHSGRRVLLVDADLRRPRVARYLGLAEDNGLADVLTGTTEINDAVQLWGPDKLEVLAAGPAVLDPSELLDSSRMRTFLSNMRDSHDHIIIDTPAVLACTDAAVVAALSDGCLLTARFGGTRRQQLAEAADSLSRVDARILGVVLTRTPPPTAAHRRARRNGQGLHDPERAKVASTASGTDEDGSEGRHQTDGSAETPAPSPPPP